MIFNFEKKSKFLQECTKELFYVNDALKENKHIFFVKKLTSDFAE